MRLRLAGLEVSQVHLSGATHKQLNTAGSAERLGDGLGVTGIWHGRWGCSKAVRGEKTGEPGLHPGDTNREVWLAGNRSRKET